MKDGRRRIWPRVGIHQAETGKRILFRENCRCEDLEEGKREGGIREEEKERGGGWKERDHLESSTI